LNILSIAPESEFYASKPRPQLVVVPGLRLAPAVIYQIKRGNFGAAKTALNYGAVSTA